MNKRVFKKKNPTTTTLFPEDQAEDRNKLIKKVDMAFNAYIRERDMRWDDTFICISCGQLKPREQMDAGHFWSRRHMSTRWDERNVNGQCKYCNNHLSGNGAGYAQGIRKKYGDEILDNLEQKKLMTKHYALYELKELLVTYKQKLKDLKKERR